MTIESIIPQNNNLSTISYAGQSAESGIKRASRFASENLWRAHVADELQKAGMRKQAEAFDSCSDPACFFHLSSGENLPDGSIGAVVCSADPNHFAKAVLPSCHLRICPDCARRLTARLVARYMPVMLKFAENPRPGWRFRKIVVTTRHSLSDPVIKDRVAETWLALRKLAERMLRDHHSGLVMADVGFLWGGPEFGSKGRRLHFHGIYYGPYLDQKALSETWQELTGDHVVSISLIGPDGDLVALESAIQETLKYTTKFWKRRGSGEVDYIDPALMPVLLRVLNGSRRVRAWGLFYNAAEPDAPACCETCGASQIRLSPVEWDIWSQTGWLPDEARRELRSPDLSLLNLKPGNKSPPRPPPNERKQGVLL